MPGSAPALLLHRGDAAPLPPPPHPAGVWHRLRCPALQLRRGPAPGSRCAGRGDVPPGCRGGCGCSRAGQSWALWLLMRWGSGSLEAVAQKVTPKLPASPFEKGEAAPSQRLRGGHGMHPAPPREGATGPEHPLTGTSSLRPQLPAPAPRSLSFSSPFPAGALSSASSPPAPPAHTAPTSPPWVPQESRSSTWCHHRPSWFRACARPGPPRPPRPGPVTRTTRWRHRAGATSVPLTTSTRHSDQHHAGTGMHFRVEKSWRPSGDPSRERMYLFLPSG